MLLELMDKLGYAVSRESENYVVQPPDGRRLVFVGDLVDRGPGTPQVLRLVSGMVQAGQAFCKRWLEAKTAYEGQAAVTAFDEAIAGEKAYVALQEVFMRNMLSPR